ncbi:efflux RND transporter periplasmic adaptor subunit [Flavobacterium psychrotrophum]|uniref:efflux RND transporter periplasmic adaptor subunit n=1 Tax=Flavobacterium psychrotrophum TaxID=2294119 RepID=UPI000E31C403|nr:efflux RND transporter periplasmic adaptor subunit [Flavobacterium psychrotrophum]
MKKVIYIVVIAAIIGVGALMLNKNKAKNDAETAVVAQQNSSVSVRTAVAKQGVPDLAYTANGNFEAAQQLDFPAENNGRVVNVLVDEGDQVRKGQVLATIKGDQLNVQLQSAKAAYENAQSDAKRYENAFKTGGVTQQQVDQSKVSLSNAKAQYDAARINIGDASIKSSINGIVNARNIEPGSVVSPGTVLFELVDVSSLKLKVNVPESQVATLKVGTSVKVTASVYPDKEFTGKITFIAPKGDTSLNFPVEITIANNPNNELKAGMYGSVVFGTSSKQPEVLTVPRVAFVGGVGNNQIFVVKDGAVTLTKVVAGRIFGETVEVLKGLNAGDVVVTSGQINLAEGSKVEVIK